MDPPDVIKAVGDVDEIAASPETGLEERRRAPLKGSGRVDDDIAGTERRGERLAVFDVCDEIGARLSRNDERLRAAATQEVDGGSPEEATPAAEHDQPPHAARSSN
jgi:hypothetical protein